jgi:hypothetical protein
MVQRDYILREIEKIGAIISAIRQKLFGGKGGNENLAITIENQVENAKGMLLNKINFDLDKFLVLNLEESNEYISTFDGFNLENIEHFADYLSELGFNAEYDDSKKYLEKALQLYDFCDLKSKTFSLEREAKLSKIVCFLQIYQK